LDPEAAAFARQTTRSPADRDRLFKVLAFERDRLGAILDLNPGYDIGGDAVFRVTGCGCAQVLPPEHDTAATGEIFPGPSFPRWHFYFLPPDSTVAVELALDAMRDADAFTADSLQALDGWWRADGFGQRRIAEKHLLYDVVGFHPDPAGVVVTLVPARVGWGVGGRVRVTAVGCAAYRWHGV